RLFCQYLRSFPLVMRQSTGFPRFPELPLKPTRDCGRSRAGKSRWNRETPSTYHTPRQRPGRWYKEVRLVKQRRNVPSVTLTTLFLATLASFPVAAQDKPADVPSAGKAGPAVLHLTLDEIKQRVLADNKLLHLAALNVESKGYATRAVQANYFP